MHSFTFEIGVGRGAAMRSAHAAETFLAGDARSAVERAERLLVEAPAWVVANLARLVDEEGELIWARGLNADLEWEPINCSQMAGAAPMSARDASRAQPTGAAGLARRRDADGPGRLAAAGACLWAIF